MKWIKCSEKMPEAGVVVLTECGGHLNVGVGNRSGANYRYITSAINDRELMVTHWIDFDDIPLPQPPQQEVKSALEIGMSRYEGAMQKLAEGGD